MTRRWAGPLAAVIIFGLLLAYVLGTGDEPAEPVDPESQITRVLDLETDQVDSVTADLGEEGRLKVKRCPPEAQVSSRGVPSWTPGEPIYQLVEPYEVPTDQERARLVFKTASRMPAARVVDEEAKDLAQYGLEEPAFGTVTFTTVEGEDHTLYFGDASPLSSEDTPSRYVRRQGDNKVYLVTYGSYSSLAAPAEEWRERRLFRAEDVDAIEIENSWMDFRAERSQEAPFAWEVARPTRMPADDRIADDLLQTLRTLKVEEFVDDDPRDLAEYHLTEGVTRLILISQDGTESLLLGGFADSQAQSIYVKHVDRPYIYTIKSGLTAQKGLASHVDWMLTRPFGPASASRTRSLEWATSSGTRRLVRAGTETAPEWQLYETGEQEPVRVLPDEDVLPLLRELTALEFVEFQPIEGGQRPAPLQAPAGSLTLVYEPIDLAGAGDGEPSRITLVVGSGSTGEGEVPPAMLEDFDGVYYQLKTDPREKIEQLFALED